MIAIVYKTSTLVFLAVVLSKINEETLAPGAIFNAF